MNPFFGEALLIGQSASNLELILNKYLLTYRDLTR